MDDPRAFEGVVGLLDYPMLIATTAAGGERSGCLVGFWTQCSIDPPRFLVCISDKNHTYRVIEAGAEAIAVHVVPAAAAHLVEVFGGETGDREDKFEQCVWTEIDGGLPILDDCPSWFAGRIVDRSVLGDHTGFVLDPIAGEAGYEGPLFLFSSAKHVEPGHPA